MYEPFNTQTVPLQRKYVNHKLWITKDLVVSQRKRKSYNKYFKKLFNKNQRGYYRKLCFTFTCLANKAKNDYYYSEIGKADEDIRKTWDNIKGIIRKCKDT